MNLSTLADDAGERSVAAAGNTERWNDGAVGRWLGISAAESVFLLGYSLSFSLSSHSLTIPFAIYYTRLLKKTAPLTTST